MASYNILRAANFCHAENFQHRSDSLNYIKIRSGSRMKTVPYKITGTNPCWNWKIPTQAKLHATFRQFSTKATGQNILFTVRFVANEGAESYSRLIEGIRQQVATPNRLAGQLPMQLNPDHENRNNWFHIELVNTEDNSHVTLRIRYGDLYFIGFQVTNGQWYEFNDNNNKTIFPHAKLLRFASDTLSDFNRTNVGLKSLIRTVTSLADYNSDNMDEEQEAIRPHLRRLMIMFPEALRFTRVESFVNDRMHSTPDSAIDSEIECLIRKWGIISMAMRRADLFASSNKLANNVAQAATMLGLVLWNSKIPQPRFNENDVTTKGRQLVEIFSVQVLNIDRNKSSGLDGEISVVDALGAPQYIFRHRINIKPKELIPLEGPKRAISAFDSFHIDVTFKYPDDQVIRGQIRWNYFANNLYEQPVIAKVKGVYGSLAIGYAVYSNAVLATVQVKLINGHNKNFYGTLHASNTLSNEPITLFDKKKNDVNDVPQHIIPLQRSMVVVPLGYSLKVDAHLLYHDLSPEDTIQGSVTFPVATSGSNSALISSKCSKVDVTVTWSSSFA